MRTARGDIWLARADALVITTNAMRRRDGAAVMGAGIARQAAERYPGIDRRLGEQLREQGARTELLHRAGQEPWPAETRALVALPTKRIYLVSDASPAAGAPDGDYLFGGVEICRRGDRVWPVGYDDRLGGLAISLDEGLRRYVKHTGAPLPEAFKAASVRPGALIGLELGVRPGALADLIVLDDELAVRRVMRRGSWLGS